MDEHDFIDGWPGDFFVKKVTGDCKMSRETTENVYYFLWFEALKLSDEYREVCEWVELAAKNSGATKDLYLHMTAEEPDQSEYPPMEKVRLRSVRAEEVDRSECLHVRESRLRMIAEKLDWSKYPHIKETYLRMGDVFDKTFEEWQQVREASGTVFDDIYASLQVRPLDLSEVIGDCLDIFNDELVKANDYSKAKKKALTWVMERHQKPEDLVIIIDTDLVDNAKEIRGEIEKLIVDKRGKLKTAKRFMAADILDYLNTYRAKIKLNSIAHPDVPEKEVSKYIDDQDCLRKIRKAKKIINNATRGQFPGNYQDNKKDLLISQS